MEGTMESGRGARQNPRFLGKFGPAQFSLIGVFYLWTYYGYFHILLGCSIE
jgi:hypothetical protein